MLSIIVISKYGTLARAKLNAMYNILVYNLHSTIIFKKSVGKTLFITALATYILSCIITLSNNI